jgi:hypothetical protein
LPPWQQVPEKSDQNTSFSLCARVRVWAKIILHISTFGKCCAFLLGSHGVTINPILQVWKLRLKQVKQVPLPESQEELVFVLKLWKGHCIASTGVNQPLGPTWPKPSQLWGRRQLTGCFVWFSF